MEEREYECPDRFVRVGNSCYYLSAEMLPWQEAYFTCTDMAGSHLAVLDKKWEDRNLRSLLKKPEAALLERWIGGIWNWELERWEWGETGRPLKYQGFPRKGRGRGRGDDNRWHCIAMDPVLLYRWKSASCLDRKHYVCETPLRNVGRPAPAHAVATQPLNIKKRGRKRKKKPNRKEDGRRRKNGKTQPRRPTNNVWDNNTV